ncbi:hypothetical protein IKF33_00835 [Candidatus Saccharibacteria bacterium]|nr:hypothetical protein [Candidatus Saccharibacteria bacterium]
MKFSFGARNLWILGVGATVLAIITTSVSILIYHNSGDIYLDRSRPGFLPDEEEAVGDKTENSDYKFSEMGEVDEATLDEYLKEIKKIEDNVKSISNPYPAGALSDKSLGIPEKK